jgi:hypothetical protein
MQIFELFFSALDFSFFGKLNTHNDPDIMRHA